MPDVHLFHTVDGGNIRYVNGQAVMSRDGLETAVYLSLFGGNASDSGIEGDDPKQWWGNADEPEETRQYRSETQYLLQTLVAIPANLRRLVEAVERDLAWMTSENIASDISVSAAMTGLHRVRLTIDVTVTDSVYQFLIDEQFGNV